MGKETGIMTEDSQEQCWCDHPLNKHTDRKGIVRCVTVLNISKDWSRRVSVRI
jgi:hypothetical protein